MPGCMVVWSVACREMESLRFQVRQGQARVAEVEASLGSLEQEVQRLEHEKQGVQECLFEAVRQIDVEKRCASSGSSSLACSRPLASWAPAAYLLIVPIC